MSTPRPTLDHRRLSHPSTRTWGGKGGVLPIVMAVCAVGVITAAGIMTSVAPDTSSSGTSSTLRKARARKTPGNSDIATSLYRAGLNPRSLAAAGLSGPDTTTLIGNARTQLNAHFDDLVTADAAVTSARQDHDRLQRLVETMRYSANDLANFNTSTTALSAGLASQASALNDLFAAATASLSQGQVALLTPMRANTAAGWEVPLQYLATNHDTQADWVQLRDDLANVRIAGQINQDPDAGCQQRVLAANAATNTSAAITNLANDLADVTSAWNAALGG